MKKISFLILIALLIGAPLQLVFAQTGGGTTVITGQQGAPSPPPVGSPGSGFDSSGTAIPPTGTNGGFVPLEPNSPLTPAEQAAAAPGGTIAGLLGALYNICIGIAVVLAIIQLTRAGVTYMLSDSITSKEQARHIIMSSVLGLLLVLSPVIVFSLINPGILKFDLNLDSLKVAPPQGGASGGAPPASGSACTTSDGKPGFYNTYASPPVCGAIGI